MRRDFMSRLLENLFISLPIYSLDVQNSTNASKLKAFSKSGWFGTQGSRFGTRFNRNNT